MTQVRSFKHLISTTICYEVDFLSDNRVCLCVLPECQPCFDDGEACSLLAPAHPDHTGSHMLTADGRSAPGVLPRCQGAGDGCQYRQQGNSWHTTAPGWMPRYY